MNYTAGGTGKGQGFPRSLVAVGGGGEGGVGSEAKCILDKAYEIWRKFSLLAASVFPMTQRITAGLTERHFQSPAERSRIRTRNFMHSNRAYVITWNCMSEINCKQSKYFDI